jgi:hypothetical protein
MATWVVTQDNAKARLDQGLTKLAAYVESVAGTDHSLITSAGMETKASRSAPTLPRRAASTERERREHEPEVNLFWKTVPNTWSYTIEASQDPAAAASWTHVGIATSASKLIVNLTSGKRYWFRVAAVSAGGQKRLERARDESGCRRRSIDEHRLMLVRALGSGITALRQGLVVPY